MTAWRRFTQMVHLTVLGLWLGTVVMAAAGAAIIFPTMKGLNPTLPAYAAYEGDHWRLAAGQVAERIFLTADIVQFVCALLASATLGALLFIFRIGRTRASTVLRVLGMTIGLAAFASQLLIVNQSMNASLRAYRAAALAGDTGAALRHQQAFAELHPIASWLMATTMVAVLVALAAGAWAAGGDGGGDTASGAGRRGGGGGDRGGAVLEEPQLLKGGR